MSTKQETEMSIVEVSFGISKTVRSKKLFESVVVAEPTDIPSVSQILFPLMESNIDERFRAMGMDPKNATETKRETVRSGVGQKGRALERRAERRAQQDNVPKVEIKSKTEISMERADELNTARSALMRLESEGIRVKSVAHAGHLRYENKLTWPEYNAIKATAHVLGLPERSRKKPQHKKPLEASEIVKKFGIKNLKHAGFLRANNELTYDEYMAVKTAGDSAWVTT